jgi:hypothetical protein
VTELITPGWRFVAIVCSSDPVDLEGLNPWDHKWVGDWSKRVIVAHPSYPAQRHDMSVYEMRGLDRQGIERAVRFAAGEFSNSVYGFYLPDA